MNFSGRYTTSGVKIKLRTSRTIARSGLDASEPVDSHVEPIRCGLKGTERERERDKHS